MGRRRWCLGAVLTLGVAGTVVLVTVPPAGADPLPIVTLLPTVLPLPTPSLPLPLPSPSLPLPLPHPTATTPPVKPPGPAPTPTAPAAQPPAPGTAPQPGAGVPSAGTGPGMVSPDQAALIIADNPAADLYPQPALPPSTALAAQLGDVEHRMQYLHNVLTRTAADLAAAQRGQGPVPQLIAGLTGPAASAPPIGPAVDTPAGRVAALTAAVASGQDELTRREAESQVLQQQLSTVAMTPAVPAVPAPAGWTGGKLLRPVPGPMTSPFGNRLDPYYHVWQLHPGIDLAATPGAPIVAAAGGRVTQAGWLGGYGNYTCIEHGEVGGQRLSTCYGHQSRIAVAVGQQVVAGQVIGFVGSTGAATGPHLHFEVRLDGRPVDPAPWLSG
jgi:murein DD-endopeptidase MepM/ murein hydrolase activator NlpD